VELTAASLSDGRLKPSASKFIGKQSIVTSDAKTVVSLTRATPFPTFATRQAAWQGAPSSDSAALIAGEYVLRAPIAAADTLTLLLRVEPGPNPAVVIQLPPTDSSAALMRVVSSGPSPTGAVVDAFLIDRSEISNAEFQRFIASGGYRTEALWPSTMTVGGASIARPQALARFVDRSGLPGPRFWTSGRFADGQADHPVVGITWYEAAAYAAWAGKALPTAAQWWRAALGEGKAIFPWGRDGANIDVRANLDGTATKGRGTMPLGMSPFGVEHMAGNAREWLADSTRGSDRRIVVGGSWQDPSYMFERSHAEAFSPGFSNDAIGFRLVRPLLRR
jgi:formylglycine-generating enzyme required for sulfatase activity